MIDAVGIGDQRVSEAAEIEQAIPIGIVAGEAGDLESENDPDVAKCDLRGEPRKTTSLFCHAQLFESGRCSDVRNKLGVAAKPHGGPSRAIVQP